VLVVVVVRILSSDSTEIGGGVVVTIGNLDINLVVNGAKVGRIGSGSAAGRHGLHVVVGVGVVVLVGGGVVVVGSSSLVIL
jgi:hypothetical protein